MKQLQQVVTRGEKVHWFQSHHCMAQELEMLL